MKGSDINVLTSLGLNKSEAIIYLDLIKHFSSTPSKLQKEYLFIDPMYMME
jgi:sugar-specific transcriptional regulator TrmB